MYKNQYANCNWSVKRLCASVVYGRAIWGWNCVCAL